MPMVDPVAAATYFVQTLGCTAFPVWGSKNGKCLCGDPHDGTGKQGKDNVGKHPATIRGFKDATADVGQIRTFLSNPGTPNYGLNAPPGILVIDVDGKDGMARWDQLQLEHGPLPVTLTTTTANGRHYFYRWPEATGPMPAGKLFGFVVRRRGDGYVIGPGSVHPSGVEYGTLRQPDGMPYGIEELPHAWAVAAVKPTDTITIGGAADPSSVPVGGRHDWLRNTARLYAGTVRDPDALFAAVWTENRKLPEPKSEADVRRAIGDVLKKFAPDPVEEVVDQVTGEVTTQRVTADAEGAALMTPKDDADLFPAPPAAAAFGGLLGQMVDHMAEGTDASRVAMLASLLAFCGALVPTWSYFHGRQTSSPFLALVGHSGIGRKGTAMYRARDALANSLGTATVNKARFDGLASGEAVVKALYDRAKDVFGHPTGVLFEEEYASFLAASGRDGSTLDTRMRSAFDGNQLAHRKVNDTITVPEPYWLSGLVAITPAELQEKVPKGSFKSGSGNRWLWLPVIRRAVTVVSTEPLMPIEITEQLLAAHQDATREPPRLYPGPGVSELLSEYDQFLWAGSVGIEADMTRRFGVITYRIGMVHAAVERSEMVTRDHVIRAMALTEYARAGMSWTFGQALGDGMATYLLRQLQEEGSLAHGTISKYMIRDPQKRQAAVDELCRLGLAAVHKVSTSGRTRSELRLVVRNGAFRDFRALIDYSAHGETPNSAHKPSSRSNDVRIDAAEPARKVREPETRDTPTTKVTDPGTFVWRQPCTNYQAHRSYHRQTLEGWVCDRCEDMA